MKARVIKAVLDFMVEALISINAGMTRKMTRHVGYGIKAQIHKEFGDIYLTLFKEPGRKGGLQRTVTIKDGAQVSSFAAKFMDDVQKYL